jgi:DNA-directed RNA polymerase specialized sigma24 family protein
MGRRRSWLPCDAATSAFGELVRAHHAALVRLARASVSSDAVAEEVAQETRAPGSPLVGSGH